MSRSPVSRDTLVGEREIAGSPAGEEGCPFLLQRAWMRPIRQRAEGAGALVNSKHASFVRKQSALAEQQLRLRTSSGQEETLMDHFASSGASAQDGFCQRVACGAQTRQMPFSRVIEPSIPSYTDRCTRGCYRATQAAVWEDSEAQTSQQSSGFEDPWRPHPRST